MGILKAAAVFSDHMILQRGKPIRVWGIDRDGNQVTVSIRKQQMEEPDLEELVEEAVLERQKEFVETTGNAKGEKLACAIAGEGLNEKYSAEIGNLITVPVLDHQWSAVLAPIAEYGGPYEMIISSKTVSADKVANQNATNGIDALDGNDSIHFTDIWIGEVWLAGGQSNMEFELKDCRTGKDELAQITEAGKQVRFYYTKKISWMDEYFFEEEQNSRWETCEDEGVVHWSAVGYYFAKRLAEQLGCRVGVIGCNWGGTSAAAWIKRDRLAEDSHTVSYLEEYDKAMEGKSFEEYLADLAAYQKWERAWQPKIDEFYREHPTGTWDEAQAYAGESLWPEPLGPKSPFRPGGLYETMLQRVCPYTLAGFLYYQGEADEYKPTDYEYLFSMLIHQWRSDWQDPTLPFLCVQLPMFLEFGAPERKNWCLIREAQMRVQQQTSNMGIAVILDKGEFGNIHPVEKETVGVRLALQALEKVYGLIGSAEANGPIFRCAYPVTIDVMQRGESVSADADLERDMHQKDSETAKSPDFIQRLQRKNSVPAMCVEFDYAEGMYVLESDGTRRTSGPVDFFELADADGDYVPAEAELCADGSVFVHAEGVTHPTRVRFQWVSCGPVTLYGANGIPAAPFRTDAF